MKKVDLVFSALVLLLFFSQCSNKSKKDIVGIWKLETFDINGTALDGSSLGNWLWEFNEEGGYLVNMEGAVEKGTYTFRDSNLVLHPIADVTRPDQVYTVSHLDSVTLNLSSVTGKNKTYLYFIKIDAGEVGKRD